MQTKRRLTKALVRSLRPAAKRYEVMCAALPGFGVRVAPESKRNPGGSKVFFVRYRIGGGRRGSPRWMRLGPFDDHYTVDRARKDAQRILQLAREGCDPAGSRANARSALTVDELCDRYLAEHAVPPNKKPSSIRMDRSNIENHVRKAIGQKKVAAVKKTDIEALKRRMSDTPGAANRVIALVSRMMTLAEEWELRPVGSNPCRGVKRYPERKRQRFLTGDERQRLEAVLAAAEGKVRRQKGYVSQGAIDEFRLLAMTGARLGEITGLQWPMVDFEHGCLRIPDAKEGHDKVILLSPQAVSYLMDVRARTSGTGYVCPNEEGRMQQNIQGIWRRVRKAAGLDDVNIHALRHSFVSDAVQAGVPLFIAGKMAGHKNPATTARYAHLESTVVREALAATGARIDKRTFGDEAPERPRGAAS